MTETHTVRLRYSCARLRYKHFMPLQTLTYLYIPIHTNTYHYKLTYIPTLLRTYRPTHLQTSHLCTPTDLLRYRPPARLQTCTYLHLPAYYLSTYLASHLATYIPCTYIRTYRYSYINKPTYEHTIHRENDAYLIHMNIYV